MRSSLVMVDPATGRKRCEHTAIVSVKTTRARCFALWETRQGAARGVLGIIPQIPSPVKLICAYPALIFLLFPASVLFADSRGGVVRE